MDQLWTTAKSLEGSTLYTRRGAPLEVVSVGDSSLKIRNQRGRDYSYSREAIEAGCRLRLKGGDVEGTSLYEEGIIGSSSYRSYLPAIILATTREYTQSA